jgi:hypothetical protein
MSLRNIQINPTFDPNSFEPILCFMVKKEDTVVFSEQLVLQISGDYPIENPIDTTLNILNSLLVGQGEPPLTTEEIVLYKLTKDYQ